MERVQQKRKSPQDYADDRAPFSADLAAVNQRLDQLTRQLARIAEAGAPPSAGQPSPGFDPVADALARLDHRLNHVGQEERPAPAPRARPVAPPPPSRPAQQTAAPQRSSAPQDPADWTAQIMARQRMLEGDVHTPAAPAARAQPRSRQAAGENTAADLSGVEQQLRQINSQISSLHQPYTDALAALRNDLAEIGRALHDAMPRQAIEALEADVRTLAERLDRTKQAGAEGSTLGTLEKGLGEVRDALRALTPAESLVGFDEAVLHLSHKIDQIAITAQGGPDPQAIKQLEQAVNSLRSVVSNVASDGALAELAAEVRALAGQFERAAADSSTEALAKLETRITALMESGNAMPPELEASIRALSERLDRMQLSQGDQLALVSLEDRIAKLSEKLDASDSRLRQFDAIERGLADFLVYHEEIRNGGPRGPRPDPMSAPDPAAAADLAPDVAPQVPRSPLDLLDMPEAPPPTPQALEPPRAQPVAAPPPPMPAAAVASAAPAAPVATATPVAAAAPTASFAPRIETPPPPPPEKPTPAPRPRDRAPIDPQLPPDTPLEPGSGAPKPGSPAARIAASEAVLGHARTASADRSAVLAAARNAAKAAYLDTPVKVPTGLRGRISGFSWPFKKKDASAPSIPPQDQAKPAEQPTPPLPQPAVAIEQSALDAPLSQRTRVLRLLKTLLIAASVTIIVIGAAQTAFELLFPDPPTPAPAPAAAPQTNKVRPTVPSRSVAPPQSIVPPAVEPENPTPSLPNAEPPSSAPNDHSSFFNPSMIAPKPPAADVTGSISRQPTPARAAASQPVEIPAPDQAAGLSPGLRAAAAANNPAAEYELGARYADGRGVPQSLPDALHWLERAANAGFTPAQFRLASLNEKGEGVKKDLQAARRLYLAAAGKGHAKAMHNLAVLYAEGIDGKPDYKVAAHWFRKAAGYGIADSQYNLAILYARGIGVETNLAESYKWFVLAAGNGDADAAKKRDDVGARLDPQTLMAAKLAAQTFVPDREPEEAINLKTPAGGWDQQPAAPAKPRKRAPATSAQ